MHGGDRVWRERGLRSATLAGNENAWRTWYEESYPGLAAYVAWRCAGLRDLADEVLQETWLTAVRRLRHFDPKRGSFADWLRGIAANVLRNQFRRRARRASRLRPLNGPYTAPADNADRGKAESVARALAQLPEHYEAVLRAKYLDQQTVDQIAADRNETPKAIESLLTRARQAFREVYSDGD
jgi:RNA polymerase sigma-70 factor (ECF subfamily)